MTDTPDINDSIAEYFNATFAAHGETARGVDWNSTESQFIRFAQLCRIIGSESGFSALDLGCGYGAMLDYLKVHYRDVAYYGYDVAAPLIDAAVKRYAGQPKVQFTVGSEPTETVDYALASGIFNAHLNYEKAAWQQHIEATVDVLDRVSSKGFAFNCLTTYSDTDKMRPDLYYSDPNYWFDRCKRRYSKQVALLHDYGPYEFTILVRKS